MKVSFDFWQKEGLWTGMEESGQGNRWRRDSVLRRMQRNRLTLGNLCFDLVLVGRRGARMLLRKDGAR